MNWTPQERLDYIVSLEEKEQLSDEDIALIIILAKEQDVMTRDERISIRSELASQLVRFEADAFRKILLDFTYDNDELVRTEACDSLCIYNDREVFNRLLAVSTKDKVLVRSYAVMSMADVAVNGAFDFEEILPILRNNFAKEKSNYVRLDYYYAFCKLGERQYYDVILGHLSYRSYPIRCCAIVHLMSLIKKEDYEKTLKCLLACKKTEKHLTVRSLLSDAIDKIEKDKNDAKR